MASKELSGGSKPEQTVGLSGFNFLSPKFLIVAAILVIAAYAAMFEGKSNGPKKRKAKR